GLVPLEGVYPLASSLDHAGPIARSVGDLALLLEVIAEQPIGYPTPCDPPRLGRVRGMFADRVEPPSASAFEQALSRLPRAGATVCDADLPPEFGDILDCHRVLMTVELAALHEPLLHDHRHNYLPCVRGLIEEGLAVPGTRYARAKQHQAQLCRDMADAFRG